MSPFRAKDLPQSEQECGLAFVIGGAAALEMASGSVEVSVGWKELLV